MVGVIALSLLGVGARAATIGTLLLYVNAQSTGKPVELLGVGLPTEATPAVFLLWGLAALLFAVLTIVASFKSDVLIFDIAQRYAETAMRRVLQHAAAGRAIELPESARGDSGKQIATMLRSDARRLVRVVIQTLGVLLPLFTMLGASVALVIASPLLTTMLIPVLAGYSLVLATLNRRLIRDSQMQRVAGQGMRRDVKGMLGTLQRTRYAADGSPEWLSTFPRASWIEEAMTTFRRVILAKKRVTYVADGFQGVALLLILMVFGSLMAKQGSSWTLLLTYLAALGYATRSMGRVSRCVTAANRHIAYVRRYVMFMRTHPEVEESAAGEGEEPGSEELLFEAREPMLPGSRRQLETRAGQRILCAYPDTVENPQLGALCLALAGGDPIQALEIESVLFFLRGTAPLPERPLWSYLPAAGGDETPKRVRHFLEGLGLREEFDEHLGDLDAVLTAELDEQLSPALRYVLRLLPGALVRARLMVLDWDVLGNLGEPHFRRILAALSDRVVLLVARSPSIGESELISHAMVVDREGIRGIGDPAWYSELEREGLLVREAPENLQAEWTDSEDWDDLDDIDDED
jgi:ABC-type multidrug transport system fused ATPase/permease subunit